MERKDNYKEFLEKMIYLILMDNFFCLKRLLEMVHACLELF